MKATRAVQAPDGTDLHCAVNQYFSSLSLHIRAAIQSLLSCVEQQQVLSVNTCAALKPMWFIYHRNTQQPLKANSCPKEKGAHGRSDWTVNAWQPWERKNSYIPSEAFLSPSVLLTSVKSWLCIIFSTISSASILVSSTRVGWLSIESFFLLARGNTGKTHSALQDTDFYKLSCVSWPQSPPQWPQSDPLLPEDTGAGSVSPPQSKVFAPVSLTGRACPAGGGVWVGEVASPVCAPSPLQGTPRSCWAPRRRCCWWMCSCGGSGQTCWRSGSAPCCNLPTHRGYKPQLLPFLQGSFTTALLLLHTEVWTPMSSSAETEQEYTGIVYHVMYCTSTDWYYRAGWERWLQITLTGACGRKEKGWQSHQWLPEILDCWLA